MLACTNISHGKFELIDSRSPSCNASEMLSNASLPILDLT